MLCGLLYEANCFMSCLLLFCSCVFQFFSIAITSLGEERANFGAFRTFVWFAFVWFSLFPLPLGVWEGLRFVILAFPRLFFYLFVFIRDVCFAIVCSPALLLLVPGEGCASWLWHILWIFTMSSVFFFFFKNMHAVLVNKLSAGIMAMCYYDVHII